MQSCTSVSVGKPPPWLMGRRKFVCNICSHALEFGWVRLPLANGQEKSPLQHLKFSVEVWWVGLSLANGQEKSGLQYLESYTSLGE